MLGKLTITLLLTLSFTMSLDCNGSDKYTKACAPASPPTWPDQFEQSFEETNTYPIIGSHSTSGKFFYDYLSKSYRVDRTDGHYDRYCLSIYKFSTTPCSHIVQNGDRYIYFPEKDYCCFCCDASHGCGVLKPDWLEGATFEEYVNGDDGVTYEKWNKPGLQSNYYWATADDRIMSKIDQRPNDVQNYDVKSFKKGITDKSVFDLPKQCDKNKTCPFLSVCTPLRSSAAALKFLQ